MGAQTCMSTRAVSIFAVRKLHPVYVTSMKRRITPQFLGFVDEGRGTGETRTVNPRCIGDLEGIGFCFIRGCVFEQSYRKHRSLKVYMQTFLGFTRHGYSGFQWVSACARMRLYVRGAEGGQMQVRIYPVIQYTKLRIRSCLVDGTNMKSQPTRITPQAMRCNYRRYVSLGCVWDGTRILVGILSSPLFRMLD